MNINDLQKNIENINNDNTLTNNQKITRIKIYQTLFNTTIEETKYNNEMLKFIENANRMVSISNGNYQIENSLEYNKISLKGNILNSPLVKELEKLRIINFTTQDLKTIYSPKYEKEHNINLTETNLALNLYEEIELIEDILQKEMETISNNLGSLFNKDIFSNTNKTNEELKNNYESALTLINTSYSNGILDLQTKNITTELLNKLFNYYIDSNKKIPENILNYYKEEEQTLYEKNL